MHRFQRWFWPVAMVFAFVIGVQALRIFVDPQTAWGTQCKILWHDAGYRVPFGRKPQRLSKGDDYYVSIGLQDQQGSEIAPGFCKYDPFSDTLKIVARSDN